MDNYTYKSKQVSIYDKMVTQYSINNDKPTTLIDVVHFNDATPLYKEELYSMHTHDFYLIFFFEEGEGTHNIDSIDYQIEKNIIFYISPLQMHSLKNIKSAKGYRIIFSEELFVYMSDKTRLLFREYFFILQQNLSVNILPSEIAANIRKIFSTLYDTCTKKKTYIGFTDYMVACLTQLLLDLLHYLESVKSRNNFHFEMKNNVYLTYINFVENNFKKIHSVKDCARGMNISLSTLDRNIIKATGMSALTILNERIILEAKRILKFRLEIRIKEVASMLGFEDTSNFTKFFKKGTGLTPLDFREMD